MGLVRHLAHWLAAKLCTQCSAEWLVVPQEGDYVCPQCQRAKLVVVKV